MYERKYVRTYVRMHSDQHVSVYVCIYIPKERGTWVRQTVILESELGMAAMPCIVHMLWTDDADLHSRVDVRTKIDTAP